MTDNNANDKDVIRSNKITREEIYNYDFTKNRITDSFLFKIIYYDTSGNQFAVIQDPNLGKVNKGTNVLGAVTTYRYIYDSTGKLRKRISNNPDLNGQINFEYQYDSLGNLKNKFIYNEDTSSLKIENREYNTRNQVTKLFLKINNADLYNSGQNFYNEAGYLIKESVLNDKGNVIYSHLYDYSLFPDKKIIYIETKDSKRLASELFYNKFNQLIKENSDLNERVSPNDQVTDYEKYLGVTEYSYNDDKTFFQWTRYSMGKKSQLTRHYYFKK